MRSTLQTIAAFAGWVVALPALAAGPSVSADWLRKPTSAEVGDAYPEVDQTMTVEGNTVIECGVTADGILNTCNVIWESPPELGFGAAALSLAPRFRMSPDVRRGKAVAGVVRIPIYFRLPPHEAKPDLPKPTSREALQLGREIAAAMPMDLILGKCEDVANKLNYVPEEGVSDAASAAAAGAIRQSCGAAKPAIREDVAAVYASLFTAEQLRPMAVFLTSPAGKVEFSTPDFVAVATMIGREYSARMRRAARTEFCKTRDCAFDESSLARPDKADVSDPIWAERPNDEDIDSVRPTLPALLGLSGGARVKCRVAEHGLLDACTVAQEAPAGLGIGSAALSLTSLYRVDAELARRSIGKSVSLVQTFPAAAESDRFNAPAGRSPKAVALANELLKLSGGVERLLVSDGGFEQAVSKPSPGVDSSARLAALAALRFGDERARAEMVDELARTYAAVYADDELAAAVAFYKGPAGPALRAKWASLDAALMSVAEAEMDEAAARAHDEFCRTRDCIARPPNLPPKPGDRQEGK